MAWEDRTPFDAIEATYSLNQNQVEDLMRDNLKKSSYVLWRKRAKGRKTKHIGLSLPNLLLKRNLFQNNLRGF